MPTLTSAVGVVTSGRGDEDDVVPNGTGQREGRRGVARVSRAQPATAAADARSAAAAAMHIHPVRGESFRVSSSAGARGRRLSVTNIPYRRAS